MPAPPPDALLLMGKQCPYCPTVLKGLESLQADGSIGKLETVVIEDHPERATELGVRTVPWVRIGPFELEGLRSEQELRDWAEKASSQSGLENYLDELLSSGGIDKGLSLVRDNDAGMAILLSLFENPDTLLNTRIGISAIMEELQNTPQLRDVTGKLGELTRHENVGIRGDACYFLSLTGDIQAIRFIRPLLDDTEDNIREIARESLDSLTT